MARYMRRGKSRIYWFPAANRPANLNAPTLLEFLNAVDISCEIRAVNGIDLNARPVNVSTLNSPYGRSIAGVTPPPAIGLEFYDEDDDSSVARPLLGLGVTGVLVLAPYGEPAAGDRLVVYDAESAGPSDRWAIGATAASLVIGLTATGTYPNASVTV